MLFPIFRQETGLSSFKDLYPQACQLNHHLTQKGFGQWSLTVRVSRVFRILKSLPSIQVRKPIF